MPEHFLNMVLIHELSQGDVLIVRLKELGDGGLELQHTLTKRQPYCCMPFTVVDNRKIANTATRRWSTMYRFYLQTASYRP